MGSYQKTNIVLKYLSKGITMNNKLKLSIITLVISLTISGIGFTQNAPATQHANQVYTVANALDMVANPARYLNKFVTVRGKFDKFSTLGLDYTPAMRSSEDYITFLIQRSDVKDHNIPLSELKIFLKRTEAEKHIDLNAGDEVEFSGKIFSNALGDVWMDAEKFTVISQKKNEDK